MTWIEYQQKSPATMANLYVAYGLNILEDPALTIPAGLIQSSRQLCFGADLSHMAQGMMSEIDELIEGINNGNKINISEEIADLLWYVSGTIKIYKDKSIQLPKSSNYQFDSLIDNVKIKDLCQAVSVYSDIPKKILAYKRTCKNEDDEVKIKQFYYASDIDIKLHKILLVITGIAHEFDIDINQALQNNIDKLQKVRYKDGFSEKAANERNLDAELKELEK